MKKTLLALLLLLLLPILPAFCEGADFAAYLRSAYPDWTVESESSWLPSAAAVLEKGGKRTLIVAEAERGAWKTVIDNPDMTPNTDKIYQVHMDTDDLLYFSSREGAFEPYDTVQTLTLSRKSGGGWRLKAVSESTLFPVGPDAIPTVMEAWTDIPIPGHWLRRGTSISDENDNLLLSRTLPPIRDVLTEEETDLSHLNIRALPFDQNGYAEDKNGIIPEKILRRLFEQEIDPQGFPGCTFDDGFFFDPLLQFIAKKPDGSRVLLCGEYEEDVGWVFTESAPLPAGAKVSSEAGSSRDMLWLPQQVSVRIARYPDGKWGVAWVAGEEGYALGPGWLSPPDDSSFTFRADLGDHPWGDVTAIDWDSIPARYTDAAALSDPAAWATPKNPDPTQRLHLRKEQSKSAKSLGKFYAGAPVKVLKKGKEWSKVQVGGQAGFMMNEFLLFGGGTRRTDISLTRKDAAFPVTRVTWHDTGKTEGLTPAEASSLILIGLTSDSKSYVVWDPYTNRTGTVAIDALYDGADG